jgi:hypothetical protein
MSEFAPNIALRAYELWDAAGRPEGRSDEFYFQAEEEFRKLLEQRKKIPLTLEKRRFFLLQTIRSVAFPKLHSTSMETPLPACA